MKSYKKKWVKWKWKDEHIPTKRARSASFSWGDWILWTRRRRAFCGPSTSLLIRSQKPTIASQSGCELRAFVALSAAVAQNKCKSNRKLTVSNYQTTRNQLPVSQREQPANAQTRKPTNHLFRNFLASPFFTDTPLSSVGNRPFVGAATRLLEQAAKSRSTLHLKLSWSRG